MTTDEFEATVLAELKAGREQLAAVISDISARVTVLERKSDLRSAIVSGVVSVLIAFIYAACR